MKRELAIGFALGATAGGVFSLLVIRGAASWYLGLPGLIVAIGSGLVESGGVRPGGPAVYTAVNVLFYATIGLSVGWVIGRAGQKDQPPRPVAPECPICGLKWVTPTSAECPQCGYGKSFASWSGIGRTPLQCFKCEYDLTGNESGVCPECGEPV